MARVSEAAHSALLLASAWAFGTSSIPSARYVSILFSVVVTTSFALYKRLYVSRSPLSVASYYTHVLDPATHADVSVTPYTQITRTCPYTCMRKYSPIVHHTRNHPFNAGCMQRRAHNLDAPPAMALRATHAGSPPIPMSIVLFTSRLPNSVDPP